MSGNPPLEIRVPALGAARGSPVTADPFHQGHGQTIGEFVPSSASSVQLVLFSVVDALWKTHLWARATSKAIRARRAKRAAQHKTD